MAKVLKDYQFKFVRGQRKKKYPDEWLDGQVRELVAGEDFDEGKHISCMQSLRLRARALEKSSHCQISGDKKIIRFQAYEKNGKPVMGTAKGKPDKVIVKKIGKGKTKAVKA